MLQDLALDYALQRKAHQIARYARRPAAYLLRLGSGAWPLLRRSFGGSRLSRSSSVGPSARYARRLRVAASLGGWRRYRRRLCSLRRRASALR